MKRIGTLCREKCLADEENFQNNVRNYNLAKYFYQYFQIFSTFIYNESLPMKSYQFCKIRSSQWEKKTGCFIMSFNMTINEYFYFASSLAAQFLLFDIRMTQQYQKGSWKQQIARNGKLQYLFQTWFQLFSNERNTNKFSLLTKCACMTLD